MRKTLFPPILLTGFATVACHGPLGGDPLDAAAPSGAIPGPARDSADIDRDHLRHADRTDRGESGLRGSVGVTFRGDF